MPLITRLIFTGFSLKISKSGEWKLPSLVYIISTFICISVPISLKEVSDHWRLHCSGSFVMWLSLFWPLPHGSMTEAYGSYWWLTFTEKEMSLSHPVLGWLYVFSLFPPPPPPILFPLTSKPFELNLWYLAQRIYGSGEMYWMTFPWPWPKVTAVASISKNLLVCAIKWEPLIGSLQNVAALLP